MLFCIFTERAAVSNITLSLIASVCVLKKKIRCKNKPNHDSLIALENSNNNCIINTVAMIEEVSWKCISMKTYFPKIRNASYKVRPVTVKMVHLRLFYFILFVYLFFFTQLSNT